jgi:hypothetical protein
MATVVNQPAESGNIFGFVLGIILLIIFAFVIFVYGLPLLQGNSGGASVSVPSTVNVQPK